MANIPPSVSMANTIMQNLPIAKFLQDLKNAPEDMKACLGLTIRIDEDLQYLIHLRNTHSFYMSNDSFLSQRREKIISATQESLSNVCRLFEGRGIEIGEAKYITSSERMKWVLGNSSAFGRRTANLQQHHVAVISEIGLLRQVELRRGIEGFQREAGKTSDSLDAEKLSAIEPKKGEVNVKSFNETTSFTNQAYSSSIVPSLSHSSSVSSVPISPQSSHRELSHEFHKHRIVQRHVTQFPVSTLSSVPAILECKVYEVEEKIVVDQNEFEDKKIAINHGTKIVDPVEIDDEDDDPEAAFYRDLRQQEEERQRRLAARKTGFP